jgi:single-strand DNA-binding protein
MSLNRIIAIGRLTKKPELRTTPQGTAVSTFTIAVDRNFGENRETDFIPVVVWKGLAESCAKHLDKGKLVGVDGRLQIRTYEDSKGEKRTVAEIVAADVQFLSPKNEPAEAPRYEEPLKEMSPMDEIPF